MGGGKVLGNREAKPTSVGEHRRDPRNAAIGQRSRPGTPGPAAPALRGAWNEGEIAPGASEQGREQGAGKSRSAAYISR